MNGQCHLCGALDTRAHEEKIMVDGEMVTVRYAACDECGAEVNPLSFMVVDLSAKAD